MKIHEYQAKALLKNYGVPVQDGVTIKQMHEFDDAINNLISRGTSQFVVKSQIHAGGRGKGKVYAKHNRSELVVEGGVKFIGSDIAKGKEKLILSHFLFFYCWWWSICYSLFLKD